jgi:branched-subunit amino acid transport protein
MVLIVILGLGIVTVATRASFFVLPARIELPATVERALRYAPACALVAIIAREVLAPRGTAKLTLDNDQLWGVVAAAVIFVRTRSMIVMMLVGMGVFTLLRLAG